MSFLQTEYADKKRNKCIKSKDNGRNSTRRPQVSGVHSDVPKIIYLCDTFSIYLALPTA